MDNECFEFRFGDEFLFIVKVGEFIDVIQHDDVIATIKYTKLLKHKNDYELLCHRMYVAFSFQDKFFGTEL